MSSIVKVIEMSKHFDELTHCKFISRTRANALHFKVYLLEGLCRLSMEALDMDPSPVRCFDTNVVQQSSE